MSRRAGDGKTRAIGRQTARLKKEILSRRVQQRRKNYHDAIYEAIEKGDFTPQKQTTAS
jgi:hypothetical protein